MNEAVYLPLQENTSETQDCLNQDSLAVFAVCKKGLTSEFIGPCPWTLGQATHEASKTFCKYFQLYKLKAFVFHKSPNTNRILSDQRSLCGFCKSLG